MAAVTATLPKVGDVVAVHRHHRPTAGTVTAVIIDPADPADSLIEVDTIPDRLVPYYPREVAVVPTPAPGRRWRCLTDPNLVLVVESAFGPVADCHTPAGKWVHGVILPGWYELVEDAR